MGRGTPLSPPPKRASLSPPRLPEVPTRLEDGRRLTVGERIGKGYHASVYRAVVGGAGGVQRVVAVKLFDVIGTDERERVLPSLARAILRAAAIRHPNVVEVYDLGLHRTQPFVLTELVEGTSLAHLMDFYASRGQRVPPDLALFIGIEVAEALHGASRPVRDGMADGASCAHGDLAAREILLSRFGEVKVSYFGIHAAANASSGVRARASIAVRALTLAPEVAQGDKPDGRSDVFALGALLRYMLVGERFPQGIPDESVLTLATQGAFQPRLFGPRLPPDLEDLLERATRADPDRRLYDAGRFAYELRRAAMVLGVGDGRVFLRNALVAMMGDDWEVDLEGPTAPSPRVAFPMAEEP
jgi:eukaryotic-like serine/threonine-protein kinase